MPESPLSNLRVPAAATMARNASPATQSLARPGTRPGPFRPRRALPTGFAATRARMTRELSTREARWRAIFDAEPECVKLLAADGTLIEMNAAGLRMIEADSLDQVRHHRLTCWSCPSSGRQFRDLMTRVFSRRVRDTRIRDRRPARARAAGSRRMRRRCAMSTARSPRCSGSRATFPSARRAEAALRESNDRLRLAVQASNVGIWDWDLPSNRLVFSREWKAQLGYEEDEVGHDFAEWRDRVHPEDLPEALAGLEQVHLSPCDRSARSGVPDAPQGRIVALDLRPRRGPP